MVISQHLIYACPCAMSLRHSLGKGIIAKISKMGHRFTKNKCFLLQVFHSL